MSIFRNRLFSLARETSGNFGMMTALLLPVSIGVVGLGLDATTMLQNKRSLQNAVDAAALATATAMTKDTMSTGDADAMAKSYVLSQMANVSSDATTASANLTTVAQISTPTPSSGNGKIYDVGLTSSYTMTTNALSQAFGWKTVTISAYGKAEASTQTQQTQKGLSLYLVLDRSGSMSFITDQVDTSQYSCPNYTESNWGYYPYLAPSRPCYINKMTSLKTAVGVMSDTLTAKDPTARAYSIPRSQLVRVGAIAFNDQSFSAQAPAWGTQAAQNYVDSIPTYPTGGTDASDALNTAYKALRKKNKTEQKAHTDAGTPNFDRYIIFMTDGEMTGDSGSWNSGLDNNVREICKAIKSDEIHLFTVAFMAPEKGKSLLQACASDPNSYYQPDTMAGLVSAFTAIAQDVSKSTTRLTN
ncbi:vWA domain-containing protein [Rhizobium oryziradicis]|nr:TadE/TadG family type IV pilus assembly protein [Rhizobium oryziradicis]